MQGVILKAISSFYYIENGGEEIECKARGILKKQGVQPMVGDIAEYEPADNKKGTLNGILPRKNFLSRPPVANIDKAFIVSSYCTPSPNTMIIDRLISVCEYKGITPILIFNKCDLGDFSEIQKNYEVAGYKVIVCSAKEHMAIEEIKKELKGSACVFTGNSGVGKSSLINEILPELSLKTGEISEKLGRGRHTTRHTQLYSFLGGYIADTPGFSSLEVDKDDYEYKQALQDTFIELSRYKDGCKFAGCAHIGEKGCAVKEAVEKGKIGKSRYESYLSIFAELKDLKPWQAAKK